MPDPLTVFVALVPFAAAMLQRLGDMRRVDTVGVVPVCDCASPGIGGTNARTFVRSFMYITLKLNEERRSL